MNGAELMAALEARRSELDKSLRAPNADPACISCEIRRLEDLIRDLTLRETMVAWQISMWASRPRGPDLAAP
jgi:hypothetical protein